MQRRLEIRRAFQPVGVYLQALRHRGVQHDVGAGNGVGGAQHAELELVARVCERGGAVAVGGVAVELGQYVHAQLHLRLFRTLVRGVVFNCLQYGVQLVAQEHGDHGGGRFVGAEAVVVARSGHRYSQQILVVVHGLDHCAQEQQELGVLVRRLAGREQVHAFVGLDGPVVVLAGAVDARERFFVEQTHQPVLRRDLLHHFHCQLVVVGGNVRRGEYRRELVLRGGNFVVLGLGHDAEFPEFFVQFGHVRGYFGLDGTEIVVVHLLALGRLGAEQRAAGEAQVGAGVVHFFGDQEIFLLGADGGTDVPGGGVAEQPEDPERLLVERFHGAQERRLFVQRVAAVGTERGGDAERVALDERVGGGVPGGVAARFKRCPQAAGREGRGVGFALDQSFAGELHDHAAVGRGGNKAVVLLRGYAGERLEPVGEMGRSF